MDDSYKSFATACRLNADASFGVLRLHNDGIDAALLNIHGKISRFPAVSGIQHRSVRRFYLHIQRAFCGSMQFVAITLLTGAFDPVGAFLMSLMVNARHLFYGVSMLGKYRGMGWAKVPLVYTLSDETFSIVSSVEPPEGIGARDFYLAVSVLDYIYWVGGSVLGALAGQFIRFDTTGLDFALTGLFVVLFIEQVKNPENRRSGVIGMACTVAALAVFGADKLVIPAMILVLVVLLLGRKKL